MGSGSTSDRTSERRFGGFRLLRRLAIGGTAEIFLASDERTRRVVLKVPLDGAASTELQREALEHEAAIGARLDHPGIVRIEGVAREGAAAALVVEYVDGISLASLLEKGPLGTELSLHVVRCLAEALDAAHRATDESGTGLGLVHRDVTPHNVLVSREGAVKLLDFGIARSRLGGARTRTGSLKGTIRYLSPEQATGSSLDARSDVYSLALVAFETLTGKPYLEGDSEFELLRAAESPREWDAARLPADLPDAFARALSKALRRFPEERFGSAAGFARALPGSHTPADELRRLLAEKVAAALGPDPDQEDEKDEATTTLVASRSPRRIAGLVLGLVIVAIGALALGLRPRRSPSPIVVPPAPAVATTPPTPMRPVLPTAIPRAPEPIEATRPRSPATAIDRTPSRTIVDAGTTDILATPPPSETVASAAPPPVDEAPPPAPTRESVRAKLARADARLRAARARGADVAPLESLARQALEDYVGGRFVEADGLLDRILARVE